MLNQSQDQNRFSAHRKPRVSTTLDRRKVVRMVGDNIVTKKATPTPVSSSEKWPTISTKQMQAPAPVKPTAMELKNAAIEKALASTIKKDAEKPEKTHHIHFGFKRLLLALACSTVAVFAIVYFANLNAPNISLKVAAMQTGIEASYPSYVPRDFSLSDITSEEGKIMLNFKNAVSNLSFSIVEEKSSWDTNALLNNFVQNEYKENYVVIREQGLTIYISNSNAAWVNGGIIYKINAQPNTLTKKQIKSIAVSL